MRYISTRGGGDPMPFADALLTGLAADGGLLLPESFPSIADELPAWRSLSYTGIAQRLFGLYADDMPSEEVHACVAGAFATFDHPDVVPLKDLGDCQLLELFHGPTLSFKDLALQVLGRLFERVLAARGRRMNILGATSGDTGSAAIHGVRGREGIGIFVLFPHGRVTPLQELQMTTVTDANVHCLAIDGSFDDCQEIVKALFGDLPFKEAHALGAVNSINWARVLVQMAHYIHCALHAEKPAVFSVPTGNFGNIFAGIAVRRMGVPIDRFVLATNENDTLVRFFQTGVFGRNPVRRTISPSMDIQIASNFERFLYLRLGQDADRVRAFLADFASNGKARLDDGEPPGTGIVATAIDTETTLATIRDVYAASGYIADPHTAVGIAAARRAAPSPATGVSTPICMATAHPAKFPDAVRSAIGRAARHPALTRLQGAKAKRTLLPADLATVRRYVSDHAV